MNPESRTKLKQLLYVHEGYREFPYKDTTGHETIGIGRNLKTRGISISESYYLLDEDISYFSDKLDKFIDWFDELDDNRQIALVDICFNVGINGLLEFANFLQALDAKDYKTAHDELLNSKAATQAPKRYQDLANIILTGEI